MINSNVFLKDDIGAILAAGWQANHDLRPGIVFVATALGISYDKLDMLPGGSVQPTYRFIDGEWVHSQPQQVLSDAIRTAIALMGDGKR